MFLFLSPLYLSPARAIGKKLTDRELQDLEDQWFEDEEDDPDDLSRWKKGPDGHRVPPKSNRKSEMAFVALHKPITKDDTSKWAAEKSDLLVTGGVDVKGYAVEAGKVLFVTDGGFNDMMKVQRFILKQDKVVDFEWNQKKSYPQATKRSADDEEDEEELEPELNVEALLARAQMQQQETEQAKAKTAQDKAAAAKTGKAKDRKAGKGAKTIKDDSYLGGAGGPIPAELPDDE